MSEEEIRALAESLGLDPERLVLLEPRSARPYLDSKIFRFEYRVGNIVHDWNFVVHRDDDEEAAVIFYVTKGLYDLAKRLNSQPGILDSLEIL